MGEKFSLISFLLFVVHPRAFTVVAQRRFPPQNPKLYLLGFWKMPVLASCYIFESVFHVNNSVQFDFALVRDLRKYHFHPTPLSALCSKPLRVVCHESSLEVL